MSDIVKRLRKLEAWVRKPTGEVFYLPTDLFDDAAAEIERLRAVDGHDVYAAAREEYRKKIAEQAAEIERLRAALEGAVEAMTRGAGSLAEYANILSHEPHAADLLDAAADRARAALTATPAPKEE